MLGRFLSRKSTKKDDNIKPIEKSYDPTKCKTKIMEIYEHERWRDQIGWSSRHLEIGDPKRYLTSSGQCDSFKEPQLEDGWIPEDQWYIII